jgi:transcription factor E
MQIPDDLLFDIVKQVAGSDTVNLIKIIKGKKNVSEFKIAEKMGISVNQVRNMIYRLQEHDLMAFIRKKDKNKGWYIYYWTFLLPKALNLMIDIKEKEVVDFEKELANLDTTRQYICEPCRIKLPEEEALEAQFICHSCGEIMKEQDSIKRNKDLTRKLKKDKEGLKIAIEIREHQRKLAKRAMERQIAKEKEEKSIERAKARKLAAKNKPAKKKVAKKVVKKKVAKKVVKKKVAKKVVKKVVKKKVVKKVVKKVTKEVLNKTIVEKPKKKGF